MAAILKIGYDVITPRRRSSDYYEIWLADVKQESHQGSTFSCKFDFNFFSPLWGGAHVHPVHPWLYAYSNERCVLEHTYYVEKSAKLGEVFEPQILWSYDRKMKSL